MNDDENLLEVVFVVDKDKAVQHTVKTGIQDTRFIEVIEGLQNEQKVVSGPYTIVSKSLENGDQIKITDKKKLFKTPTED